MKPTAFLIGGLALLAAFPLQGEEPPRPVPNPFFLMRSLDADRDRRLSREEFARLAERAPRLKEDPRRVDFLFDRLDADRDGRLTLEELGRLRQMAPGRPPAPPPVASKPGEEKPRKTRYPEAPSGEGVALVPPEWKAVPVEPLTPAELDGLMRKAQQAEGITPAARAADDVLVRRLHLDLAGRLPTPAEVEDYLESKDPERMPKLVDRLLGSEDFVRQRARTWRDVILARATEMRPFVAIPRAIALERWLREQFRGKRSWAEISRALITAEGELILREPASNGQTALLLSHTGMDGAAERANDVARIFLGINIQCAQCHDHPTDVWKRGQFHEMAAYFGRTGDRVRNRTPGEGFDFVTTIVSRPFGEYRMPDQENPDEGTPMRPRFFLTGEAAGDVPGDRGRRAALADAVTASDSYYFAAAFVNRVWAELLGRGFVEPVEEMGPMQPATYPEVLARLASSFRATGHDVRALYRTVVLSEVYQRRLHMGDTPGEHVHFAGASPTWLRAEPLWDSVVAVLGGVRPFAVVPGAPARGPRGRRATLQETFQEMFAFDPSLKQDEVEATVPQALMLMNNEVLNAQIRATGFTALARILRDSPDDDDAIRQVYLRALGRLPTEAERRTCREHLREVGERGKAFEDLLWVLINSAELRTKR